MAVNHRRGKNRSVSWLPFITAAIVMILLCLAEKPVGNRWFVFLFTAVWLNHLCLLLLFPRNVTDARAVIAIFALAVLCRLALVSVHIDESTAAGVCVSVFFDLGALAVLMGLLHHRRLELRWSILYALNPVILHAVSDPGSHNAALIFFLLGAIHFYDVKKWSWMTAPAVAAAWVFYQHLGQLVPHAGPFQAAGGLSLPGPIHLLVGTVSGSSPVSAPVSFILLCTALFYGCGLLQPLRNRLHKSDPVSGCFFAIGAGLLFSRSISIGMVSWVIPFIALRPSASWALLTLTLGAGVLPADTCTDPGALIRTQVLIWVPFWVLFAHDLYLAWHRKKAPVISASPTAISVVIPAINEADRIEACIAAAKAHPAVREIIVVDGGSTDNTVEKAQQMLAVTVKLPPGERNRGRGGQIYRGIKSASKDLVAIVHADTRVNEKMFDTMLALMARQPMLVGGAVGSVFDASGWRFRLLEIANDFRTVCMGISFGDQVQFFRREPVIKTDLFPDIPLMEDVEFAIRLHRLGRQAYLFGNAEVSTRKWEKQGMGHALTVIRLFGTYLLQRLWKTPDTRAMYRTYYGN